MQTALLIIRPLLRNHHTRPELTVYQTWNEEKGFVFIVRCVDATEIFGHKREFPQDVEPRVGQPVSFIYEVTEKGGSAKKVLNHTGIGLGLADRVIRSVRRRAFQTFHSRMKAVTSGLLRSASLLHTRRRTYGDNITEFQR